MSDCGVQQRPIGLCLLIFVATTKLVIAKLTLYNSMLKHCSTNSLTSHVLCILRITCSHTDPYPSKTSCCSQCMYKRNRQTFCPLPHSINAWKLDHGSANRPSHGQFMCKRAATAVQMLSACFYCPVLRLASQPWCLILIPDTFSLLFPVLFQLNPFLSHHVRLLEKMLHPELSFPTPSFASSKQPDMRHFFL